MKQIRWIWDDQKASTNFLKHEIAFSEAALVFETIGRVGPFLIFVVHTLPVKWESEATVIGRIVSARIATSFERRAYEDGEF
jgi:uncharacterized DUF497 family protein